MSALNCPNCGTNLSAPHSIRVAEYYFGHLLNTETEPNIAYDKDQSDVFSIICTSCNRLVRTLPLEK